MSRGHGLFLALLVSLSARASSPPVLAEETKAEMSRLLDLAKRSSRALETVRSLTDEVGPRLAGSPGDAAAVAWAIRTMTALGFSNVHSEPVLVPHWERGEEAARVVSPVSQRLVITALGGSVPTSPEGLEAEIVETDSLEALGKLGEAVRGRVVFMNRRTERTRDGSGYGTTSRLRVRGPSEAAKLGAVGYLLRSVGTATTRVPHTGTLVYADGVARIPAAALPAPDADFLHRLLERKKPVRLRLTLGCRNLPDAESANVVGDVPGREKPEEIVVLGAHLDSWDLGQGAVDDGAGCAIVSEAARLVGALARRPRRTLRVILYANEENGARGGKAYVEAHKGELARHVAALEADSGAGRCYGFTYRIGAGSEAFVAALKAFLWPSGSGEARDGEGGVDIGPLREAGVPAFGVRMDSTLYFDVHHSADDTFEKIDAADLDSGVGVAAALAYAVADLPEPLPRVPPEK
ncbi:MAG TPA: M28 family peptidase [Thermoanaerobaculia bacterium]|nr:M28 family peptidase [Thermoanaerobaculia bacterium]